MVLQGKLFCFWHIIIKRLSPTPKVAEKLFWSLQQTPPPPSLGLTFLRSWRLSDLSTVADSPWGGGVCCTSCLVGGKLRLRLLFCSKDKTCFKVGVRLVGKQPNSPLFRIFQVCLLTRTIFQSTERHIERDISQIKVLSVTNIFFSNFGFLK